MFAFIPRKEPKADCKAKLPPGGPVFVEPVGVVERRIEKGRHKGTRGF